MAIRTESVSFNGGLGYQLAGKIDFPSEGSPKAFGVFAHCFTCSMETHAARRICNNLAERGFAMLRFDFTGLAKSGGLFEETNFQTNIKDILSAVQFISQAYEPPKVMIGHSLGGAATLFAAPDVSSVKAVVTVNAPCDPAHVRHHFEEQVKKICEEGEAHVMLSGRPFKLQKHFIDALSEKKTDEKLASLKAALLVCHTPKDKTVSIEQAAHIFMAAKHPKSFLTLDDADHLVTKREDSAYIANVIDAWASRYI